jgi:hypothetical protein
MAGSPRNASCCPPLPGSTPKPLPEDKTVMPLISVARADLHDKIRELEHRGHKIGSIIPDDPNHETYLVFVDVQRDRIETRVGL